MSKDLDLVSSFIKLAKEEGVGELKFENKEYKIQVSLAGSGAPIVMSAPQASVAAPAASTPASAQAVNDDSHVITSPFVGTYYSSPAPGKPTFVKVGDRVSKGQTLCILEAMKIMNEIEADVDGEVLEICVDNESLVEFGQPLFKIRN